MCEIIYFSFKGVFAMMLLYDGCLYRWVVYGITKLGTFLHVKNAVYVTCVINIRMSRVLFYEVLLSACIIAMHCRWGLTQLLYIGTDDRYFSCGRILYYEHKYAYMCKYVFANMQGTLFPKKETASLIAHYGWIENVFSPCFHMCRLFVKKKKK